MEEVSLGEIQRTLLRVERAHGRELADIKAHLKELNGSVARHEVAIADQKRNLSNLNNEVFCEDRTTPAIPPQILQGLQALIEATADENKPALTRRDIAVLGAFGKATWAIAGAIVIAIVWLIASRGGP